MADEIRGRKMSDYTPLSDLTQAEQETYLANAAVTTYGKTSVGGKNTNVNVPLSAIKPDVPVTDVQVGGTSVVSSGVAAVPAIPNAASLADGNTITANNGKLSANVPVTDVTADGSSVVSGGVAVIPKQVNADWNADGSSSVAKILNKPDLSVYAVTSNLATVATSGSYNDLTDQPTIPNPQVNADWNAEGSSSIAKILNKPDLSIYAETSNLATVATTGKYNDLLDKPNIPEFPNPTPPNDWANKDYVLGIQNGKLAWVELETTTGSGAGTYSVEYK